MVEHLPLKELVPSSSLGWLTQTMTFAQIYDRLGITPNLQAHMFRVTYMDVITDESITIDENLLQMELISRNELTSV